MALNLTLLNLPNLLVMLDYLETELERNPAQAETINNTTIYLEQLLTPLGRPQILAQTIALRETTAKFLSKWNQATAYNERLDIEHLLRQNQLQSAYERAQALVEKTKGAGSTAYPGADYEAALAHDLLARVLRAKGQVEQALNLFIKTQIMFEAIGPAGERMVSVSINEQANCLRDLGRFDEAIPKYEERIKRSELLQDLRGVATGQFQLSSVRYLQGRYNEALTGYAAARQIFEQQNEPASVATAWHQMGRVHQEAGHYAEAEAAYRQSLALKTQLNLRAGQASTLNMLGLLYKDMSRLEEAVVFYRQAAEIYVEQGDLRSEGVARNNIANALRQLKRYAGARHEIQRAIECDKPFGHAAEPWKTFALLREIEEAEGQAEAARQAWLQARAAYLAYRRQGGYAQGEAGRLIDQLVGMIQQGQGEEVLQFLAQAPQDNDSPERLKILVPKVLAILIGQGDKSLADDPALTYSDAAEVLWLLERVASG